MTRDGHVWIAVGECDDGSILAMHSFVPTLSLSGTPSKAGKRESQAVKLARKYMKKYYGKAYKICPNIVHIDKTYRTKYARMRWNSRTLSDPDGYRNMSAEEVLADLFSERSFLCCRCGPPLKKGKARVFHGLHQVRTVGFRTCVSDG